MGADKTMRLVLKVTLAMRGGTGERLFMFKMLRRPDGTAYLAGTEYAVEPPSGSPRYHSIGEPGIFWDVVDPNDLSKSKPRDYPETLVARLPVPDDPVTGSAHDEWFQFTNLNPYKGKQGLFGYLECCVIDPDTGLVGIPAGHRLRQDPVWMFEKFLEFAALCEASVPGSSPSRPATFPSTLPTIPSTYPDWYMPGWDIPR